MKKCEVLVQMCSWRSPSVLRACINSLVQSKSVCDTEIVVALNEADKESVEYLMDNKIPFAVNHRNYGTSALDYTLSWSVDAMYVVNASDDMLFHRGWDYDLLRIMQECYPCSASCFLVERQNTNNPIVFVDDLGEMDNPETYKKFIENVDSGKYKMPYKMISYAHPILVKTSDYLRVGGYSHNLDSGWFPGYGLDDFYPFRLWKLHNQNFRHIASDRSCVYHGSSLTMQKHDFITRVTRSGREYFHNQAEMTIEEFRRAINIFTPI